MKALKDILVAYQNGERGLPTYHELAAMVEASEPIIDGYPLWSGLPPAVERGALSDAKIMDIAIKSDAASLARSGRLYSGGFDNHDELMAFARAILAAQAGHIVDANKMVKQFCADCGKRNFEGSIHTCTPPLDQPLIAEAARDDVAKMDGEESRAYLIKFMRDNFTDKTFSRYINENLAGDFAYQMANAIAAVKRDDVAGDAA